MAEKNENWQTVLNSDRYMVSDHGNVVDLKQMKYYPLKTVKRGYPVAYVDGGYRTVHSLIFEAFKQELPKDEGGYCHIKTWVIDHIDNNKNNPYVGNLQLLTYSQNTEKYHRDDKQK
jgi:hypothetical protein